MDMSHTFLPDDHIFAQGLEEGDIVMCWDREPRDAVMRVFRGVEARRPIYADKHGMYQHFRFARPLDEYIEREL